MEIIKIVGIGIIAAVLSLTLKKHNPELALLLTMAAGVLIFLMVIGKLAAVITLINETIEKSGINKDYINLILKIIGIAYIAEFGVQICNDAGENGLGSKIEFGGKVLILVVAAPILLNLIQLVFTMVQA